MTRAVFIVAAACALVGLAASVAGWVLDPLALPFQDWELMPAEQQQAYQQKSEAMQLLRWMGNAAILGGGAVIAIAALVGPLFSETNEPASETPE